MNDYEMDLEALRAVADAINAERKLLQCAEAVAERRGWAIVLFPPGHPFAGKPDHFTTRKNWKASLLHMLSMQHRLQYAALDHRRVCRVLGFDPWSGDFGDYGKAA